MQSFMEYHLRLIQQIVFIWKRKKIYQSINLTILHQWQFRSPKVQFMPVFPLRQTIFW